MEIRPLQPPDRAEAARIITDALLHDPGWLAVGPDHTRHRRFVALRFHRAASRCSSGTAVRGRRVHGWQPRGRRHVRPGPLSVAAPTEAKYVASFLAAGPGPIVRGLRTAEVQDGGHPEDEHAYLWFLAVDPARQRAGLGRALLARVCDDAEAPVYLDTTNPDNVPYYAANGFEEIGRGTLPRDTPMWFMRRP